TRDGTTSMPSEQAICALVVDDFLAALIEGCPPRTPAASVLPAMRVLQAVQDEWDAHYGSQPIPGRTRRGRE
ncbi:MAG: gfo/Idh/MocA family oxidoreductase, partial [Pseudomonadota bacterium]